MGRLDVVISNAGYTRLTNFMNFDEQHFDEDWDKCFLYNVKAHMWLAYACREHLDVSEGAFITTASIAGVKPSGSSLPYAVTKAASIHLTKCLANICAPKIRFNSVSPGLMLTEWGLKFSEQKREAHKNGTKLKRLPEVDVSEFRTQVLKGCWLLIVISGCCGSSTDARFVEEHDGTERNHRLWSDELNGYPWDSERTCGQISVCAVCLCVLEVYGILETAQHQKALPKSTASTFPPFFSNTPLLSPSMSLSEPISLPSITSREYIDLGINAPLVGKILLNTV
jgi:hypothetical protein